MPTTPNASASKLYSSATNTASSAAAASTVEAKKKEDVAVGALTILHKDMTMDFSEIVINIATNALRSFYKGEKTYYNDIAFQIKKDMEEASPGRWQVIVGRTFGSYVSYEVKKMIYFFLGQVGFLIYKHG